MASPSTASERAYDVGRIAVEIPMSPIRGRNLSTASREALMLSLPNGSNPVTSARMR
jgi:hypothetical protein